MGVQRMDNVGIVVADLPRMIAFFTELGLELEGQGTVAGPWVDGCIDIDDARCDVAMLRTPDGHAKVELSCFQQPRTPGEPAPRPVNTYGYLRMMFAVDDLDDTLERLRVTAQSSSAAKSFSTKTSTDSATSEDPEAYSSG